MLIVNSFNHPWGVQTFNFERHATADKELHKSRRNDISFKICFKTSGKVSDVSLSVRRSMARSTISFREAQKGDHDVDN